MSLRPRPRPRVASVLGVALATAGLPLLALPAAQANPAGTGLVINEVYGGGGNSGAVYTNDFVELYNPTSAPLSTEGLSLQYRSASGTGQATLALPVGSVPSHGYYLIQLAAGSATIKALPTPDATGTIAVAGTGAQVYLVQGTTAITAPVVDGTDSRIIDFVGWGAATTYEGTGPAPTTANATSVSRAVAGVDTNDNKADFATATTPTPTNSGPVEATPLAAAAVGNKSLFLGSALTSFTLSATGGKAPYTWTATGLPAGVTVASTGAVSGTPTAVGTSTVSATVTDADGATANASFTITVSEKPVVIPIADVQGDGDRSPKAPATGTGQGETVTVEGVVTGMYADVDWAGTSSGFDGMYIQTGGTGGTTDATPGRSDAIFVYGSSSMPAGVAIGDSVSVTGKVSEYAGLTEITPSSGGVVELDTPLEPVTPFVSAYPTTEAGREALEGMLVAPTDDFIVSNVYSTNQTGDVGLAVGDEPLKQPTEFVKPSDAAGIAAIKAENANRAVNLDDGTAIKYQANQTTKGKPVPYLTDAAGKANPIRVGAKATLTSKGLILDYRNSSWGFQPQLPITTNGAEVATFEDTRTSNLHPRDVGGDLKLATFNVLNYFTMTGEEYVAAGPKQSPAQDTKCTYYTDRASNRITNNECGVKLLDGSGDTDGRGPRGAATAASLTRQQTKLVAAINALGADIIGLEEVENSIKLPGKSNRDEALASIVTVLNAADPGTWAYVKSPAEAMTSDAIAEQDVIRPAFIYKKDTATPVGTSDILFGTDEFANAREPLAQAFKATGGRDEDAFAVVVNHYKSKGDNSAAGAPAASGDNANDAETGVGAFNGDRVRQSQRLLSFVEDFRQSREVKPVFLIGDFNSYTKEEPIDVLVNGGFSLIESDEKNDFSYAYSGLNGSLDHVLANAEAKAMTTKADTWLINANESLSFTYSRYNYNVTDFWQPELPFGTSDHNPEIVGINVPDTVGTTYKEIQVVGTNDFHGRLLPDAGSAAGAAPFATAVKELRQENEDTIFVAAGDLVGASTFESFVQKDEPTIKALNAMGLEVSAAGNHEFDRGYADLTGRLSDEADWEYIAANVQVEPGMKELAKTWSKTIDGVDVGFVGAVTEDLPALVSPAGIKGVTVTDVVDATNAAAATLKANGADVVVLLVHEGSSSTDCSSATFTDANTVWGNIVQNVSPKVDAIVSGHTHLAYNCRFTVADWAADSTRSVTKRPVVSAGQYGTNLNKLVFKFDAEGHLAGISQDIVAAAGVGYAPDPTVQQIVDEATAYADVEGAKKLGTIDGALNRATYKANKVSTENRGGESALGNNVAEIQRWATDHAGIPTDIAFMNPGGLRADLVGTSTDAGREISYREAADVQPFANTLVNVKLTGAQIKEILEQQWQRNATGGVPSRPFLKLGISAGFTYTYTETPTQVSAPNAAPVDTFVGTITGMWLNGKAIKSSRTYSVTANSFLASGGDNFTAFKKGTSKVDSGQVDLAAMVDYFQAFAGTSALDVDYRQRGVAVTFPDGAPASYNGGDTVAFSVGSWSMSTAGDPVDDQIIVKLGETELATVPVDNTASTTPYDALGSATVSVTLPAELPAGATSLTLVGATTGTRVSAAALNAAALPGEVTLDLDDVEVTYGSTAEAVLTATPVDEDVETPVSGTVAFAIDGTAIGSVDLVEGRARVTIPATVEPGEHELTATYLATAAFKEATVSATVTVAKRTASLAPVTAAMTYGTAATVVVPVSGAVTGTVTLTTSSGTVIGKAAVSAGKASIRIGATALKPGTTVLTATYSGDARTEGATGRVTVKVAAASATVSLTATPTKVKVKKTKVRVSIKVSATGVAANGTATVSVSGQRTVTVRVVNGRASVRLKAFGSRGTKTVTVRFGGSTLVKPATATLRVKVTR